MVVISAPSRPAAGVVQDAICSGAQQQCQPVAGVTANGDDIDAQAPGNSRNLHFRPADHEVASGLRNVKAVAVLAQLVRGLFVDFVLYCRQVHRYVGAVGDVQRFHRMQHVQFCLGVCHQFLGSRQQVTGGPAEINCHQNFFVCHSRYPVSIAPQVLDGLPCGPSIRTT